jgi:c-di-GMP phosphodiesterase
MGLLSVIEALLNVPMKEVLSEIPVDEVIKNVLLGLPSRFRPIFDVVLDYESGTWKHLEHSARAIGAAQKLYAGFVSSIAEMGE